MQLSIVIVKGWTGRSILYAVSSDTGRPCTLCLLSTLTNVVRAVPEIILGGVGGPQALFCPVSGGCVVDVSEGWGGNVLGVKAYLIHSGAGLIKTRVLAVGGL